MDLVLWINPNFGQGGRGSKNPKKAKSARVGASGLVNFVTAVAYHLCPSLPAAFTQPGASTFADLCRSLHDHSLQSFLGHHDISDVTLQDSREGLYGKITTLCSLDLWRRVAAQCAFFLVRVLHSRRGLHISRNRPPQSPLALASMSSSAFEKWITVALVESIHGNRFPCEN